MAGSGRAAVEPVQYLYEALPVLSGNAMVADGEKLAMSTVSSSRA